MDRLVGPYPEVADRYRERSPIHYLDEIAVPVLVLQGLEDRVVPPQAEAIVAALAANGIPYAYLPSRARATASAARPPSAARWRPSSRSSARSSASSRPTTIEPVDARRPRRLAGAPGRERGRPPTGLTRRRPTMDAQTAIELVLLLLRRRRRARLPRPADRRSPTRSSWSSAGSSWASSSSASATSPRSSCRPSSSSCCSCRRSCSGRRSTRRSATSRRTSAPSASWRSGSCCSRRSSSGSSRTPLDPRARLVAGVRARRDRGAAGRRRGHRDLPPPGRALDGSSRSSKARA